MLGPNLKLPRISDDMTVHWRSPEGRGASTSAERLVLVKATELTYSVMALLTEARVGQAWLVGS